MIKNIIAMLLSIVFVVACSSSKKPTDESANLNDGSAQNNGADITTKPIAFDPLGSDSGTIAGLSTVHFGYDSPSLTEETKNMLKQNAEWMKSHPNAKLQIEGHCDSRGSNEYNLTLGERRANTVKSFMQGLGVDAARMSVISYGEEKPIAMGDTEADYAKNRRANFVPAE